MSAEAGIHFADLQFAGMDQVFRPAAISDGVMTIRQGNPLSIRSVHLRLKAEVGRQMPRAVRIQPVVAIANDERGRGWSALLIFDLIDNEIELAGSAVNMTRT